MFLPITHPRIVSTILSWYRKTAFLVLGLALLGPLEGQQVDKEWRQSPKLNRSEVVSGMPVGKVPDNPWDRGDWLLYWYGGRPTVDYLKFRLNLAQREMERWPDRIPGGPEFKSPETGAASLTAGTWRPIGPMKEPVTGTRPDMDSGRLVDIVTHPTDTQILYVATGAGGVFKTTNANFASLGPWNWTNITDSIPSTSSGGSTSVGALAMSPADPNTLYLGMGDREGNTVGNSASDNIGFYKSINGGGTWSSPVILGNTTLTYGILPLSASVVLVCGNDGLYRSTTGGTSFTKITAGLTGTAVWSIQAFTPTDLVCTEWGGSAGIIYYTADAGLTWTVGALAGLPGTPNRMTVATSASSATTGWALVALSTGSFAKGLLKTTDKGHTWSYVAAPTATGSMFQLYSSQAGYSDGGQASYNQGIAVDPADVNKVWVGANPAMYRTMDGGVTWVQMSFGYDIDTVYAHPDYHCSAWSKTGTPILFMGSDGGLCIVRDPYRSAIPRTGSSNSQSSDPTFIDNRWNQGLNSYQIWKFGNTAAESPGGAGNFVVAGLQDNGTRARVDDGSGLPNSTSFGSVVGGDGTAGHIHAVNGNQALGSLPELQIFRTMNGWASASFATSGIGDANGANAPFVVNLVPDLSDVTGNTIYTHSTKNIYQTTNYANSWTALGTTGITASRNIRNLGVSKSNPLTLAVVTTGGTGYITTNGGSTWTQFGVLPNNNTSLSFVWFDTGNSQIMYTGSVAQFPTSNHLWKSIDGGATWTGIDGNPGFPFGIPVEALINDPINPNIIYAATDVGVYRSDDRGGTWFRFGTGLPLVNVKDIYIAPDSSFLRAATFGRGVWELGTVVVHVGVAVTPLVATVPAGSTQVFSATVTYSTTNNTVNWTVSPSNGGTFSSTNTASDVNTTFTAGATPGSYTIRATSVEDGTRFSESAVTVTQPCTPTNVMTQNFDGVTAPALPAGWTENRALGTLAHWTTSAVTSDTPPNAAFTPSSSSPSDNRLDSPAFSIAAGTVFAQASFKHAFDFEPGYDGGVLEISINGGAFTDIVTAGGSFMTGGYTGVLDNNASANPLGGRSAWTGTQSVLGTVIVNLPAASFGQSNNKLRWRAGSDSGTSGSGWIVDTFSINACAPSLGATHFSVTAYPTPTVSGTAHTVTVTAQDAGNATVTSYAGTVHITSSDPAAVLPANATLTSGVGTFSLTMNTAGTQAVTATDTVTASITGSQTGIFVIPGAAATITATSGTPQSAVVSTAFATALTATVRDSGNNPVAGLSVTFAAPVSGASGTFGGSATVTTDASGVATAPTFSANATTGSYLVTATVAGVVTPANFSLTNSPTVATHFSVATYPTPTLSGAAHTFTVTALDAVNATVPTYTGTVHITSSDPAAVLPANATLIGGVGTFSLTMTTAGTQFITATDTVTASITGSQTGIFVIPGAAATITATSGTPQSAVVSTAFGTALIATVRDSGNNPVPGLSVTFTAPVSGASGTFGGSATVTTNASGLATAPTFTANATIGSYLVTASVVGVVAPANFSLTNGAAIATHFAVAAYPTPTLAGAAHTFTVTALDSVNATVPTYTGTVHITSSDPAAVLPANATLTSGVGTFNLTMNTAGTQTITATDTVTASITGSQAGIVVNPGAAATIVATSGTPQSVLVSTAFATTLTATVRDSSNNPVSGVSVTFAAPLSGASGTFGGSATVTTNASGVATAPTFMANATAGSYTVTATAVGIVTPANFSLTNTAAVATHFAVAAYPTPTLAGATHTFTVTALDAGNATVPTYTGTVHITSSDPAAVLPANATLISGVGTFSLTMNSVGTRSITATDTVTASITGSQAGIIVNPGAAATIVTTSGTPQSVLVATTFATTLTATVRDSGNNPVPGVSVTFAAPLSGASGTFGGSATVITNASGVATAPTFTANATAGSYLVTASAAGVVTPANFSLTNNPAPVITITVSPTIATILTSGTAVLTGTVSAGAITWTTSGGVLNTTTGLSVTFTPSTSGTFTVTATSSADTSKTATATVNVKTKDQDANGTIDVLDLATFARYYGTNSFAADLNGDGIVDDLDLTIFLTGF